MHKIGSDLKCDLKYYLKCDLKSLSSNWKNIYNLGVCLFFIMFHYSNARKFYQRRSVQFSAVKTKVIPYKYSGEQLQHTTPTSTFGLA